MSTHSAKSGLKINTPQVVDPAAYVRTVSKYFLQAHPEFNPCPENMRKIMDHMIENGIVYDADTLEDTYQRFKDDMIPARDTLHLDTCSAKEYKRLLQKYGVPYQRLVATQTGPAYVTDYNEPESWKVPAKHGEVMPIGQWESNSSPVSKSIMDTKIANGEKLTKKEFAMLDPRQYSAFMDQNGGEIPEYLRK